MNLGLREREAIVGEEGEEEVGRRGNSREREGGSSLLHAPTIRLIPSYVLVEYVGLIDCSVRRRKEGER